MLPYQKNLKDYSRLLRSHQTDAEQVLWSRIRKKQIRNVQFYRQRPIGRYIVDFYAPSVKLVIEIDGSQHFEIEALKKDKQRDAVLQVMGLKTIRFDNLQVLKSINEVVTTIFNEINDRLSLPTP